MNTQSNHVYSDSSDAKSHALAAYILLLIGIFTAIPMLIGAIWAMVKRRDALGTIYHSHYTNAIRVFWYTVLWTIVGAILIFVAVGYIIFAAVWLWALYRIVRGLVKILADEPYPF
jgi:uncharacterized membrane protein